MTNLNPLDAFRASDAKRLATTTAERCEDLDISWYINRTRCLAYIEERRLALRRHLNVAPDRSSDRHIPCAKIISASRNLPIISSGSCALQISLPLQGPD